MKQILTRVLLQLINKLRGSFRQIKFLNQASVLTLFLVITAPTAFAQSDRPQYVNFEAGWQWPAYSDGITYIPVCWENPDGYSTERQWVRNAIANTWESAANISFNGWEQCSSNNRGIRILITDTRSNSRVGTHLDGVRNGMELNFTFENFMSSCQAVNKKERCVKSIAVHEFGHALGFAHEQDRDDSTCDDERGNGGGWKVTDYDPNSVMNYCNPRWNNDGVLSQKDIQGVQTLYGAKVISSQGQVFITNELGTDQAWENLIVDFNSRGASQFFHVNGFARNQVRTWNITTGTYCFKIWSYAAYADNFGRFGYGEGCFNLQGGSNYSFNLVRSGWNPGGYFNLALQNVTK